MRSLSFSPDAIEKMQQLRQYITKKYGKEVAEKSTQEIIVRIQALKESPFQCPSVRRQYGVESDYRRLYVAHNHIFYRVEDETVRIMDVYHEREDFLFKLFGVSSIDPEAEAYWEMVEQQKQGED